MRKGFAITGLIFVFVALIFGAANHIYFAHQSKQKAIDFAFVSDGINSIATDFPTFIADSDGDSLAYNILMKSGCDVPSNEEFEKQIKQGISDFNTAYAGTGIQIEVVSADYNVFPSACPKDNPKYCGSVASVDMVYKIKTEHFEREVSFNDARSEVCTPVPLGQ